MFFSNFFFFQMNIGRRAMGALSVRYGTQYVTGNIAEAICKYKKSIKMYSADLEIGISGHDSIERNHVLVPIK